MLYSTPVRSKKIRNLADCCVLESMQCRSSLLQNDFKGQTIPAGLTKQEVCYWFMMRIAVPVQKYNLTHTHGRQRGASVVIVSFFCEMWICGILFLWEVIFDVLYFFFKHVPGDKNAFGNTNFGVSTMTLFSPSQSNKFLILAIDCLVQEHRDRRVRGTLN